MRIAPARPIVPKDGRNAPAPHRSAGLTMLPSVSVPTLKGNAPATTAAAGPALDPLAPCARCKNFTAKQLPCLTRSILLSFLQQCGQGLCSRGDMLRPRLRQIHFLEMTFDSAAHSFQRCKQRCHCPQHVNSLIRQCRRVLRAG